MNNVTATATGGTNNYGVRNVSSSPTMNNVTATATGGDFSYGVVNTSSSPTMNNVTATATDGTHQLRRVQRFVVADDEQCDRHRHRRHQQLRRGQRFVVSDDEQRDRHRHRRQQPDYGVYNISSSPKIRNSSITGTTSSVFNDESTAQVADTALGGAVVGSGFTCVGVYDTDFVAANGSCVTP